MRSECPSTPRCRALSRAGRSRKPGSPSAPSPKLQQAAEQLHACGALDTEPRRSSSFAGSGNASIGAREPGDPHRSGVQSLTPASSKSPDSSWTGGPTRRSPRPLPQSQDRRDPPAQPVPQARCLLTRRGRAGSRAIGPLAAHERIGCCVSQLGLADRLARSSNASRHTRAAASTRRGDTTRSELSWCSPDVVVAVGKQVRCMACCLLHHRHEPRGGGVVFAAFNGHESPLRRRATLSCRSGGHPIWWRSVASDRRPR